jgi:GNAT superfamily N-acetyltransferase
MASSGEAVPEVLITTYLHMTDRTQFIPATRDDLDGVLMLPMESPDVRFYKFLYSAVGEMWRWRDRLIMPEEELLAAISSPDTSIHVLYVRGVPAGYVELVKQRETTEIAYFGLRPEYMGQGLGKHLLSCGIQRAWDDGARRVWVHTCNLDGPYALPNYLKRGFTIYETRTQPMPERYA